MRVLPIPPEIQRLLPMTPAVFYTMLAISPGALHGYAIMQQSATLSSGAFKMGPATLYSTIQRLVDLGLVKETPGDVGEDARRRYYELTTMGRQVLESEVARMNEVVKLATARLVQRTSAS
ncbi:MAG: transcriptional regulator, PadR family [Bryobacterales bacterium]|jgi:DNA-binding PadR family transcriptional regulator|nr:transcriptional regulator, PadR family [Bryobacterales bacterium]